MTRDIDRSSAPHHGRYRLWLAAGCVVALAVAALWSLDGGSGNAVAHAEVTRGSGEAAFRPSPTQWASLTLVAVRPVTFREELASDGKIAMNEDTTTPVFSPYSGRVTRLIAKPGDEVERGAPLFAIEAAEFVQDHHDLVNALAALETAQSRLSLAQAVEKRQRELLTLRGGARKDYEQARSDLIAAQEDQRAAEIALAASRNRLRILGCSDAEIAGLERMSHIDAETIVSAPIRGMVLQRKMGLGQYINVGGNEPVFTIGDLASVWLVANVRESDAPQMKVGAAIEAAVLAYPNRIFKASLTYVAPALDPSTRRLTVRAEIHNPTRELVPGMFASFRIVSGEDRLMPAVPQDAVIYDGAHARVWVADPAQKSLGPRPIEVGMTTNGVVEVRKGLDTGEMMVTSGALFIDRAARRD